MSAWLQECQEGFRVFAYTFKQALRNKKLIWLNAFMGILAFSSMGYSFYRITTAIKGRSFPDIFRWGIVLCVVSAFCLVFELGLLFYVISIVQKKKAKLLACFIKGCKRFGYSVFWFQLVVAVGFGGLASVVPLVLPGVLGIIFTRGASIVFGFLLLLFALLLVGPRLSLGPAVKKGFSIFKNNFFIIVGFTLLMYLVGFFFEIVVWVLTSSIVVVGKRYLLAVLLAVAFLLVLVIGLVVLGCTLTMSLLFYAWLIEKESLPVE